MSTSQRSAILTVFSSASGQLENAARVRQVRREIARAKTILRQKAQG